MADAHAVLAPQSPTDHSPRLFDQTRVKGSLRSLTSSRGCTPIRQLLPVDYPTAHVVD